MGKFKVGDLAKMTGTPFVVEVLEIGTCDDVEDHDEDERTPEDLETIRFKDPGGQGDDWAHSAEFELAT